MKSEFKNAGLIKYFAFFPYTLVDANYWKRIKNKRICSRHFTKECYERDLMKELLVGTNFKTKPLKLKKGAIPTLDLVLPDFRPMQQVIKNKVELKPDNAQGAIRIGPNGKIIVVEKKIPVEPEEIPDVDDDPEPPSVEEDAEQVCTKRAQIYIKKIQAKQLVKSNISISRIFSYIFCKEVCWNIF